jgi:hypothetical protein
VGSYIWALVVGLNPDYFLYIHGLTVGKTRIRWANPSETHSPGKDRGKNSLKKCLNIYDINSMHPSRKPMNDLLVSFVFFLRSLLYGRDM